MASEKTNLLAADPENNSNIDNLTNQPGNTEDAVLSDSDGKTSVKAKWTKKQMLTAASLSLMNISLCISFGIIAPFYPQEAAKKGATTTEVGLVFGVFQLVMFITAPIYGTFIQQIGAKYMFLSGAFILGGCSISFGFLDRCPDGAIYVAMCFICRSVEANGCSMLSTASFAIMATTFPNNVGQAIGILEIFSGLGMILGPSIGGGLYGVGGYLLPFLVIGGLVWVTTVISYFVLPAVDGVPKMTGSMISLLKIPGCTVIYLVIIGCGMSLSFLDPTFSPWMLNTFKWMTVPQVGLIFMIGPGVYALSAPFSGFVSDKGFQGPLAVIGVLVVGVSFMLMGPNPWLATFIPTTLPETIIALVVLGLGIGAGIIPMFPLAIAMARAKGFEDNLQTYGLVSGFFQSGFSLGAFVGPSAAGYFAGKYGFAWSSSICGFINIAVALVLLTYIIIMKMLGQWPLIAPKELTNIPESSSNSQIPSDSSNNYNPPDYGSINA